MSARPAHRCRRSFLSHARAVTRQVGRQGRQGRQRRRVAERMPGGGSNPRPAGHRLDLRPRASGPCVGTDWRRGRLHRQRTDARPHAPHPPRAAVSPGGAARPGEPLGRWAARTSPRGSNPPDQQAGATSHTLPKGKYSLMAAPYLGTGRVGPAQDGARARRGRRALLRARRAAAAALERRPHARAAAPRPAGPPQGGRARQGRRRPEREGARLGRGERGGGRVAEGALGGDVGVRAARYNPLPLRRLPTAATPSCPSATPSYPCSTRLPGTCSCTGAARSARRRCTSSS